jgi:hypothetical protein
VEAGHAASDHPGHVIAADVGMRGLTEQRQWLAAQLTSSSIPRGEQPLDRLMPIGLLSFHPRGVAAATSTITAVSPAMSLMKLAGSSADPQNSR